jgi:hypothetical protein
MNAIARKGFSDRSRGRTARLELFERGMREVIHRSPDFDVPVEVRPASLGDNAGAIGAAFMAAAQGLAPSE